MEDPTIDRELDDVEEDFRIRVEHLSVEATSVLREMMTDTQERPELRAAIAKNVLDLAYRYGKKKDSGT